MEYLKMLDLADSLYAMSFVQDVLIWSKQERLCKTINMKFHFLLGQVLKHLMPEINHLRLKLSETRVKALAYKAK